MENNSLEPQLAEQTVSAYEFSMSKMQDAIELLQEQLESLKQELEDEGQENQSLKRELVQVHQDLISLNRENQELYRNRSEQLSLSPAKALAQVLLNEGKLTSKALAELLSAIYDTQVKPEDFNSNQTVVPKLPDAGC